MYYTIANSLSEGTSWVRVKNIYAGEFYPLQLYEFILMTKVVFINNLFFRAVLILIEINFQCIQFRVLTYRSRLRQNNLHSRCRHHTSIWQEYIFPQDTGTGLCYMLVWWVLNSLL